MYIRGASPISETLGFALMDAGAEAVQFLEERGLGIPGQVIPGQFLHVGRTLGRKQIIVPRLHQELGKTLAGRELIKD